MGPESARGRGSIVPAGAEFDGLSINMPPPLLLPSPPALSCKVECGTGGWVLPISSVVGGKRPQSAVQRWSSAMAGNDPPMVSSRLTPRDERSLYVSCCRSFLPGIRWSVLLSSYMNRRCWPKRVLTKGTYELKSSLTPPPGGPLS